MVTQPAGTWTWHVRGDQGTRAVNADAVASRADQHGLVVALADGIGDHAGSSRAALLAASAAVAVPSPAGPAAALTAAVEAVRADPSAADCVLVVAQPFPGGYRIGWVGDVRAYAWDGTTLRQLTTDHTLAQYFRDHGEEAAPRMEHLVTTSVRTSTPARYGRTEVRGPLTLLLTSDGVHKTLADATIAEIVRNAEDPARSLVAAARTAGSTDNATAVAIDHRPHLATARLAVAA